MRTLIIIPAYNEEKNIKITVQSILNLNNSQIDYIVILIKKQFFYLVLVQIH